MSEVHNKNGIDPHSPMAARIKTEGEITRKTDPLYARAVAIIKGEERALICFLQYRLDVSHERSKKLIEAMIEDNIITDYQEDGFRYVIDEE